MSIISLVNQKGGTGKTTAAVHLAYWLQGWGKVVLVDADAQQSSGLWFNSLNLPSQYLVESNPEELFENLPKLSSQYDFIVIDGPGSLSEVTKSILARCDLALVPCQPSGLDLHSSGKILRFIRHARELRGGQPLAALFLSRAIRGTNLLREAQEVLLDNDIPLLNTIVYQRQCIADAPVQGKTVFQMAGSSAEQAAQDYKSLFHEVLETITHGKPSKSVERVHL